MVKPETNMKFCVIGGTGRSGTTILRKVLAKNPAVADVPEWRFTVDPDGLIDFYRRVTDIWSPVNYHCSRERLFRLLEYLGKRRYNGHLLRWCRKLTPASWQRDFSVRPRYERVNIAQHVPSYLNHVSKLKRDLSLQSFAGRWRGMRTFARCEMQYCEYPNADLLAKVLGEFWLTLAAEACETQYASVYLEKNTWNILYFDTIRKIIPQAKLVHIYRDPRDVVASFSGAKQTWMPNDPLASASVYRSLFNRWLEVRACVPEDTYREISLESLCQSTEPVLRGLCEFWDIPWHDAMLSVDLSKGNHGRWKSDIPKEQHDELHEILERPLKHWGYLPTPAVH